MMCSLLYLHSPGQTDKQRSNLIIKGRFTGENIRLIHDIMQFTENQDISGLLM